MDDQKNIKPDFSKAGEDSILYKKEEPKTEREKIKYGIWFITMDCRPLSHLPL